MAILVLAQDYDPTADAVLLAARERGHLVHRLNTAWFPQHVSVRAALDTGRWVGVLRTPHRTIDLAEITAVCYRSPEAYRFPDSLSTLEKHHANLEAKYGLGGVLSSLPALWVNHPSRIADAAYKPVQLTTAAHCGLRVPETILTNDADTARSFVRNGPTITKLLGSNSLREQGTHKISFTRRVTEHDIGDLTGIETTTHLFQRWVPKQHEARVIVIGDRITVVAIHATTMATHVDWRADYDALSYELIELPAPVKTGVRDLMKRFGLRYGALDFVITPEGDWVFLEINPAGQYGWLEAETGAPLTEHLVTLLTEGTAA